ncbi:MAG: hypothetical protein ABJP48_00505 [Erythrobacter sp.]
MKFRPSIAAITAATGIGLAMIPAGSPASASGSVNLNPPRVCFENASDDRLYFRAVYRGNATGGTMLSKGGKFCTTNPAPNAVRISRERGSATLCTAQTAPGQTYTLTRLNGGGQCSWSRRAH